MLAALTAAILLQTAPAADPCAYDREAMLALSPEAFDQDLEGGWRLLGAKPECREVAADLIAAYRTEHRATMKAGDLHTSYWHEGQLRASLNQPTRAVRLLMAGVNPDVQTDGFQDYALGTVAFLNRDMPSLMAARARLAATPEPDHWAEAVEQFRSRFGLEMKWPLNLEVLDGLIACFGKPYSEAYGQDCRPST